MPQSTWNYCRKWKFMCYQTSTDNNTCSTSTWMRSGIVNVSFSFQGSELDIIFNLVNQHYSKGVGNYIVYNKEYVYARILFTNDQTQWTSTSFGCFSRSTAFIVDFKWEVNCTQQCNNYRPITTVQYRRILYGHVVGMVRCDWPFTVGYIITTSIWACSFSL